jgi:DNA-directed RNA polymerase specialized sigma24 family protein
VDFDTVLEIYQETLIGVHQCASQPGFNPDHPMKIVRRVARCRAIDQRRRCGHRPNTNEDAILGVVAADLRGSDLGLQWRLHMGPAERNEFWRMLPEIIAILPPRQRLVAECFVNHYEEFRERDVAKPLADAVSAVTGKTESVAAVMSAWRFARERIAEELCLRGYTFINLE